MIKDKLKARLDGLRYVVEPGRAFFVAGGIVAGMYLGVPHVELIEQASEAFSHMISLFPFEDAALGMRSFYDGAMSYTAAAWLGFSDWVTEAGLVLSSEAREIGDQIRSWAGERTESLRSWFHDSLSATKDIVDQIRPHVTNAWENKGTLAWRAIEAFGMAWGALKGFQEVRSLALRNVKKLAFWNKSASSDQVDQPQATHPSVIQSLTINIAIGGEPVVREAEKQMSQAFDAVGSHPFDALKAGDESVTRRIKIPVELAETLKSHGVSKSDVLFISGRLDDEARKAFSNSLLATGMRKSYMVPPEESKDLKLEGGIIIRSEPRDSRKSDWDKFESRDTREQPNDISWHH